MTFFHKLALWWEQYRDFVIKFAMISLAAVTTTFVYLFQRPVMPDGPIGAIIAGASAVSLVLIYVGLAVAKLDSGRRRRVMGVAIAAAAIETIYGTIYVAIDLYNKNNPTLPGLLTNLPDWAAWALAFLHAAPFSILLFLVAQFVFHDPSRDVDVLKQLRDALKKIEEQSVEILFLSQNVKNAESQLERIRGDNQVLQQLREQEMKSSNSNTEALQNELLALQAEVDQLHVDIEQQYNTERLLRDANEEFRAKNSIEIERQYESERVLLGANQELRDKMLQLMNQIQALEIERNDLLEIVSNSNTSNTSNGHGNYTDQITAILNERPDASNQEIHELTGIAMGTLKVIASRVRKRMSETSVLN